MKKNKMKNDIRELKNEIQNNLRSSAITYYETGINIFHESRMKDWINYQPAIGNLSISIELILKALVAKKAFNLLYQPLPNEIQLILYYPDSLPEGFNYKACFNDLKSFKFDAIKLNQAISLFYNFYPESKFIFKTFFKSFSNIRNMSVHGSIPEYHKYELERLVFYTTQLFKYILHDQKIFRHPYLKFSDNTNTFITNYQEEKNRIVRTKLEIAVEIVKSGKTNRSKLQDENWEAIHVKCPICGEKGICYGESVESTSVDEEGIDLIFECDRFICKSCGLELEDIEELSLAGMEISIDRNDDLIEWGAEFHYDPSWQ